MASPGDSTILAQWEDQSESTPSWVPTAPDVAAHLQSQTTVKGGWGREAEAFNADTRIKGRTVDQLIRDVSEEVALIGGNAPTSLFAGQCRRATLLGVCADIEASLATQQGNPTQDTRDYFTKRYDKALDRLEKAIGKYQAGDHPGETDRQRGAGVSSIPRDCASGPASVGW